MLQKPPLHILAKDLGRNLVGMPLKMRKCRKPAEIDVRFIFGFSQRDLGKFPYRCWIHSVRQIFVLINPQVLKNCCHQFLISECLEQ